MAIVTKHMTEILKVLNEVEGKRPFEIIDDIYKLRKASSRRSCFAVFFGFSSKAAAKVWDSPSASEINFALWDMRKAGTVTCRDNYWKLTPLGAQSQQC